MNSIFYYFLSFFWGICILLSFIGWGDFLKKAFFSNKEIDWAQRAAWGVAWTIFIGGLLNLCRVISPLVIWFYMGVGVLCFLFIDISNIKNFLFSFPQKFIQLWQQDKIAFLGIAVMIIWIALYYSTWIVTLPSHNDDLQGYAVFPEKMLEQGSLGPDPFSDRRTSALGGHSFLQAMVLSLLQVNNLRIIDPGIAYIIAFGLLWGLSKSINVPSKVALLPIFFLLLIPPLSRNTTSLIMGLVLFLALFRLFEGEGSMFPKGTMARNLIIALLAAAICASKSNFIVFCSIFLVIFYLLRLILLPSRKDAVFEGLTVFILICIFILPWMISSYQSSGTLLYPLLGRGYHRSAYGFTEYPPMTWESFKNVWQETFLNLSMVFVFLLYLVNLRDHSKRNIILISAIFKSILLGLLTMNILDPAIEPQYSFAFFYASLMTLMIYALSETSTVRNSVLKKISYGVVLLSISFFLHDYFFKFPKVLWTSAMSSNNFNGLSSAGKFLSSHEARLSYFKAQRSIPPGQTIIVRSVDSYLLNFKRNPVYIVDFLILGPKPGMPVFFGGEAVAKYLLSQKIRYVLYSYCDFGKKKNKIFIGWMRNPKRPSWVRQQFLFTLRFQQDIEEIMKTRKKIFFDNRIVVIDLKDKV